MQIKFKNKFKYIAIGAFMIGLVTNVSLSLTDPFVELGKEMLAQTFPTGKWIVDFQSGKISFSTGESSQNDHWGFNDQGQFAQRYWQQNPVMCGEITSMSFDNNQQTSWNNTIEAGGSVSMTGGEVHLNASNSQGGQTATGRSVNTIPATKFECEQTPTGTTTCLSRDCQ